jgi:hypothetical protein
MRSRALLLAGLLALPGAAQSPQDRPQTVVIQVMPIKTTWAKPSMVLAAYRPALTLDRLAVRVRPAGIPAIPGRAGGPPASGPVVEETLIILAIGRGIRF